MSRTAAANKRHATFTKFSDLSRDPAALPRPVRRGHLTASLRTNRDSIYGSPHAKLHRFGHPRRVPALLAASARPLTRRGEKAYGPVYMRPVRHIAADRGREGRAEAVKYEVRGPDPDGDWFVVMVDGDDETAIDETFATEAAAQAEADRRN